MSDVASFYWAMPPLSRTLATAIFVASAGVYSGMISFGPFWFHYQHLLQFPPGLHRLVTSFLITGKDLGILFDTYFVYSYSTKLENGRFSRKEDYLWYLMIVSGTIVFLNQVFTGAGIYLRALIVALCYSTTQDQRGQTATLYVITIPAQTMPLALLTMDLVMGGFGAFYVGLTGLVAAHLFDFLNRIWPEFGNGPNLISTPSWLSWIIQTPRISNTNYGSSFAPPADRGGRSGPLPDSWRSMGPGHRLG